MASQRATIAQLAARIGELLGGASPDDQSSGDDGATAAPLGMPGRTPVQPPERPRRAGRGRTTGCARRRMLAHPEGTRRVVPALTTWQMHEFRQCPDCGVRLAGGSIKRSREVIERPRAPVEVTSHVDKERRCLVCKRRWVPRLRVSCTLELIWRPPISR